MKAAPRKGIALALAVLACALLLASRSGAQAQDEPLTLTLVLPTAVGPGDDLARTVTAPEPQEAFALFGWGDGQQWYRTAVRLQNTTNTAVDDILVKTTVQEPDTNCSASEPISIEYWDGNSWKDLPPAGSCSSGIWTYLFGPPGGFDAQSGYDETTQLRIGFQAAGTFVVRIVVAKAANLNDEESNEIEHTVSGSIQSAVSSAAANATIVVARGIYEESLNLNKNGLTVVAEDCVAGCTAPSPATARTIIRAPASGEPGVTIGSSFSGITFRGFAIFDTTGDGHDHAHTLVQVQGNNNTVSDNLVQGRVDPRPGDVGILIQTGSGNGALRNTVQGTATGISVRSAQNTTVHGNLVRNNTLGLHFLSTDAEPATGTVFRCNRLSGNGMGAENASGSGHVMDAERNWWGSVTGPTHGDNPGGSGETVGDNVDFSPWSGNLTCTTFYAVPTRLTFAVQPGPALAGEPLSPQPVVWAVDENGFLGINFGGEVSLALEEPDSAVLGGTTSAFASGGIAAFTDVSVDTPGVYRLVASAEGLESATSSQFTVVGALTIVTDSLPGALAGAPYSATLQAVGGTPPYSWSIVSGSLPDGLSLGPATGVISGIPTQVGSFNFTVQVQDSVLATDTQALSLQVAPPGAPPAPPGMVALWPASPGIAAISWWPQSGVTYFRLQSALDPDFTFGVNTVDIPVSSLPEPGNFLTVGMPDQDMLAFYYRLAACNPAGCSPFVFAGGMAARRFPAGTTEHWSFVMGGYQFLGFASVWGQNQVSVEGKVSNFKFYEGIHGFGGLLMDACTGIAPGSACTRSWAHAGGYVSVSQDFPPLGEVGVAIRLP